MKQLKLQTTLKEAWGLKYILEDLGYSKHDFQIGTVNKRTEYVIRFYNGRMFRDKSVKNIVWAYTKEL